jgi:hypothetical protein
MVRLFRNLTGNSIQYRHPDGAVLISVSARQAGIVAFQAL